jgi:beta-glucosidase
LKGTLGRDETTSCSINKLHGRNKSMHKKIGGSSKKKIVTIALAAMSVIALGQVGTGEGIAIKNVRPLEANKVSYHSDYGSKEEAIEAGAALNKRIAEEGMVLVKNENKTLPLVTGIGTNATRVSVFGYASYAPAGGGSASGDTSGGVVRLSSDIYSSLSDAGYQTNPVTKAFYQNNVTTALKSDYALNTAFTSAEADMIPSFNQYGDAGIVVISAPDTADKNIANRYALNQAQLDLVKFVEAHFDKVIVLVNSSRPLQMAEIEDDAKVDAVLIIGEPGDNGLDAVGEILNGTVNPSGRLSDTYARDLTKDPSYPNYNTTGDANAGYKHYLSEDGLTTRNAYLSDYEEGVYVGYRYYETRGFTDGSTWYDSNVLYTFGTGLSYTDFSYNVVPATTAGSAITKDSKLSFNVEVTNTGSVAGKDVVELYFTAPYGTAATGNSQVIEKPYVVLGDFAKTDIIQPGDTQTVTVKMDARDMASYDYETDKTYVLDKGTYGLKIQSDAHNVINQTDYVVSAKELVNTSASTGAAITNRFDDVNTVVEAKQTKFVRSNWDNTFPTAVTEAEQKISDADYAAWSAVDADDSSQPWYDATTHTQADATTRPATAAVKLADLVGQPYDSAKWDTLLDELTVDEMKNLIEKGGFQSLGIDYIGKPFAMDTDGPKGWTGSGTKGTAFNKFAAEPVIAATWNKELAYEMGKMIGDQGLWGSSDRTDIADGGRIATYTGWYAPGMNTHRSPFDGRYTEYYSEDGYLTGMMAANASLGAKSKGCYVFLKHFALHDDGGGVGIKMTSSGMAITGYRGTADADSGLSAWCNEQAMREVYLKPFQIAVEKGAATAAMSSFTRIGSTWAGSNRALLTDMLRTEWGFHGMVVTDIAIYGFLNADNMIRAGGDFVLHTAMMGHVVLSENYTTTQISNMRKACKNILYTVANSNAMQVPLGAGVYYIASAAGDATVGAAYTAALGGAVLNTTYAYSTISYSISAGALPAGLTLDAATGAISGTPTKAGEYTFAITAAADGYESSTQFYTIVVNAAKSTSDLISESNSDITTKISSVTGEIDATNSTVAGVKTDVAGVKSDVAATNANVDAVSASVSKVNGLVTAAVIIASVAAVAGIAGVALNLLHKKEN